MNYNNKFWNPDDKEKKTSRRRILKDLCLKQIIPQQKRELKMYQTKPNQYLIHDKDGNYKIVSKYYYYNNIEEDEYDTDTELYDEEWDKEVERIQTKYNKKTT
jgi:hypothetical protein